MKLKAGKRNIYVLIDTELKAREEEVMEELLKFKEVTEVHVISGQYDLLAVAEIDLHGTPIFSTVQELSQKLVRKIRQVSGIRDTNTIVPFTSATR